MSYLSPFELLPLDILSISTSDKIDVRFIKKRILAEFELNDNEPLEINNQFLSKNEVLKLVEGLEQERVL